MDSLMLIPDGDRRYALANKVPLESAYSKASKVFENLIAWISVKHAVPEFTFFGLSYNNLIKRKKTELNPILRVQAETLNNLAENSLLHDNKIKVAVCGQRQLLPKEYLTAIQNVEEATKDYKSRKLNLLLGYSGTLDFENAVQKTIDKNKKLSFSNIVSNCEINNSVDFVVRTANENRLSDGPFFLTRYSEFHSIKPLFPDLKEKDIDSAIEVYNERERTFGK